jgi:hypothetical protein
METCNCENRAEHLFVLQQELALYDIYQKQVTAIV